MRFKTFLLCLVFVFVNLFANSVFASTTESFNITSGTDASTGTASAFSESDITKLSASDDTRIQSNGPWPNTGEYDESKYIEFVFTPNIPSDAVIESATISHEFRRSGSMSEAKLEVWDGANFTDQALTTGSNTTTDHTDTVDIFSVINTATKVNNLKARFLAFRTGTANTTTSHDFISFSVTYSIPIPPAEESIPTPPDSSPTPPVVTPVEEPEVIVETPRRSRGGSFIGISQIQNNVIPVTMPTVTTDPIITPPANKIAQVDKIKKIQTNEKVAVNKVNDQKVAELEDITGKSLKASAADAVSDTNIWGSVKSFFRWIFGFE